MLIKDLYLKVLSTEEGWREISWLQSIFALVDEDRESTFSVKMSDAGYVYRTEEGEYKPIEDRKDTKIAPLDPMENIVIPANAWVGVGDEPIKTTVGNAFVNRVIQSITGTRMSFMTGVITPGRLEAMVADIIVDDSAIAEDQSLAEKHIAATQAPKLIDLIYTFTTLTSLCVPSLTEKLMTPPPGISELKAKLFKEYEGKLDDPVAIAAINKVLFQALMDHLEGDESLNMMIKSKSLKIAQAKKVLMYGGVGAYHTDGKVTLIKNSLYEGLDFKDFPAMQNAAREGSQKRGLETALGGEWMKFIYRTMQNSRTVPGDCGTLKTKYDQIDPVNMGYYYGLYYMDQGLPVMITEKNAPSLIGRPLQLRTPMHCKEKVPNYCAVCAGKSMEERPEAIAAETSKVGSTYMGLSMGAMHGKELKTNRIDLSRHFN